MITTAKEARRIIQLFYPQMKFRITARCTIGVRPIFDPSPTLCWRKLDQGVNIGCMLPNTAIDWDYSPDMRMVQS